MIMKFLLGFSFLLFAILFAPQVVRAQDVNITIPASNIFNRAELNTLKNVLNTGGSTNWRIGLLLGPVWPEIISTSGNNFTHTSLSSTSLPTEILLWQLNSIGGSPAPFRSGDTWPIPYKSFTNSSQTWYQPRSTTGGYAAGNVVFNFKIPADKFSSNAFKAGNYSMNIGHNYWPGLLYIIDFTPGSFKTILTVPAAIEWMTTQPTKLITISSLSNYRTTATYVLGNLGTATIGNTVNYNLHAKSASSLIQFTSSKGVTSNRSIGLLQLGSSDPKLQTKALTASYQNFNSSNFIVEVGNRNTFILDLSISASNFKTYFFEAGTYTFQLNLDAKNIDNTISSFQNTDVTIQVNPLSEISIPLAGKSVDFNFNTVAKYQDGQSKTMYNQIKLSNNENFELYVKSDGNYFKKSGITSDINSNILEIGVEGSTSVSLSTTPQKIISSGSPTLDQELNIKYNISPASATTLIGKEKTNYSIDVIYSFTAL